MKKYKVCVYAICKNEEHFVDRWVKSMSEADAIYVLDTGSTDNTVNKLKEHNVNVKTEIIKPWRFDVARNKSLDMVPADCDICICTDLDEVIEPGWRDTLEKIWQKNTNRLRYNYNWSFDEYGVPAVNFYIEKIHQRQDYKWTHPVHEVLTYLNKDHPETYITTDDITVNHYPDHTKSRSSYLPLLELSVKEDPDDDRNMHYLGREYMFHGEWNKAIDTLIKHLSLPKATWKAERCASMRFIARCYQNLNRYEETRMWYKKATLEDPSLREPFVEYGIFEYQQENYQLAIKLLEKALTIPKNAKIYINEPSSYDGTVEDILSICYFNINNISKSYHYVTIAHQMKPNDTRITNNYKLIQDVYNK